MGRAARLTWRLLLCLTATNAVAQPSPAPLALVRAYADGRVSESVVGPRGFRAWTPMFPRVDGWTDPPGTLPVAALEVVARAEGDGLRVRVSVLRGSGHEIDEPVAEVVVGVDRPVVVDALRRVGLQPLTLSAVRFAAPALPVPRADSRVDGLSIEGIEPVLSPVPGYMVSVLNRTDVPIVTFSVESTAGGFTALSGQQGDRSALPLVVPGGTFTFRFPAASSRETGRGIATSEPLDAVALTGVIWADGRLAGDQSRLAPLLALHRGRQAVLRHIVRILGATRDATDARAALEQVRRAIAAVPVAATPADIAAVTTRVPSASATAARGIEPAIALGSRDARDRLVADIDRVRTAMTPAQARQWLDEALVACEAWAERLTALFPPP